MTRAKGKRLLLLDRSPGEVWPSWGMLWRLMSTPVHGPLDVNLQFLNQGYGLIGDPDCGGFDGGSVNGNALSFLVGLGGSQGPIWRDTDLRGECTLAQRIDSAAPNSAIKAYGRKGNTLWPAYSPNGAAIYSETVDPDTLAFSADYKRRRGGSPTGDAWSKRLRRQCPRRLNYGGGPEFMADRYTVGCTR